MPETPVSGWFDDGFVVVTGSTRGIGDGGGVEFVRADMRDPDDIVALFEATNDAFGGVDVLVNNAGVQTETSAADAPLDDGGSSSKPIFARTGSV